MIAAALGMVLGGLVWIEEDVPDLLVQRVGVASELLTNYRHADFDGDGTTDLALPSRVLFQRAGRFAESVPPPGLARETVALADLWDRDLYLQARDTLEVWRWEDGQWSNVHRQPLTLRDASYDPLTGPSGTAGLAWARFLHDLDGDGDPEIAEALPAGIGVFARRDGLYAEAGLLDVYPPLRPTRRLDATGPEAHRIGLPGLSLQCTAFLDGQRLSVVERQPTDTGQAVFHVRAFRIGVDEGRYRAAESSYHATIPLPWRSEPCRLNGDDVIDFAAAYADSLQPTPVPLPLARIEASTDGGRSLQSVRSSGFAADGRGPFLDVNGDGRLDLVVQESDLFRGGLREMASRALTGRSVRHTISVHLQDADGRFSPRQDAVWTGDIVFSDVLWRRGPRLEAYLFGELADLSGDFDGDGHHDLLVQDRPDRLALYLWQGRSFARTPRTAVPLAENAPFAVADVDGDGRADIVTYDLSDDGVRARVFLTREEGP